MQNQQLFGAFFFFFSCWKFYFFGFFVRMKGKRQRHSVKNVLLVAIVTILLRKEKESNVKQRDTRKTDLKQNYIY